MKTSVHLLIAFGSLFGVLCLAFFFIFVRYKWRADKRNRTAPIDKLHEATVSDMGAEQKSSVVFTSWGFTPVVGVGPNRTRTYFNGWFGLDAPSNAGWSRYRDEDPSAVDGDPNTARESHFSQASRRSSRRSQRAQRDDEESGFNDFGELEKNRRTPEVVDVDSDEDDEFEEAKLGAKAEGDRLNENETFV